MNLLTRALCVVLGLAYTISAFSQFTYPQSQKSDAVIRKFGHEVPDPYRWLEEIDSKPTMDWLDAQEQLIRKYRNDNFSEYTVVEREVVYTILSDSTSDFIKNKQGSYYFSTRLDYKSDNSPTLLFRTKLSQEWGKLLSTAQFLRNEQDAISIRWTKVSPNDSFVAVGISHGGADWTEIVIVDMFSQKLIDEPITQTKFGISWGKDGIFYMHYTDAVIGNEISSLANKTALCYHKLTTNPKQDLQLTSPSELQLEYYTIGHGSFLITNQTKFEKGKVISIYSYIKTDHVHPDSLKMFLAIPNPGKNGSVNIIGAKKDRFIALSNFKASNGMIMQYDYNAVNKGEPLVEMFFQPLLHAYYLRDRLFCTYMDKGNYMCMVFDTAGKALKKISLPEGMGIEGFDKIYRDSFAYYYITSFAMPKVAMRFNLNSLQSELPENDGQLALSSKYITHVVSYKSKDSTDVFMYLTYDKTLQPDANTPVLLYAYGGFGVPNEPEYNPMWGLLLRRKVILAIPLVRGGGEFGEEWHEAGRGRNKQNSVDDIAYAAKWLIDNHYTSAEKIVLEGGSQGGWLMATSIVQYPSLFKAAVPSAGVYDLLRYNQFSNLSRVGLPEFGDPDDSLDFESLLKVSPYHNIKAGVNYPACMAFIGNRDDRVVPFHTYKLIAALQEHATPDKPYLLYLEKNAGHGTSASGELLERLALNYTFVMRMLGLNIHK